MPRQNLIVVVIDRLHAGMLGAYGNGWIRTDQLDHLACQSFLFDQAFVESPDLETIYRAYWQGLHACQDDAAKDAASLPRLLRLAGWHTALLTDEPQLVDGPLASEFDQQRVLETPPVAQAAADVAGTQMAQLFMAATEWLASPPEPFLLWVHARAMGGPWDAPLTLRRQYADEEDPTPPDFVDVPNYRLADNYDPDELLGISQAYAGQVALLDQCLGALADHLEESKLLGNTQWTTLAARGFSLGEHRRVGPCDESIYGETMQIPWLMRFPDGLGRMQRGRALVVPADLPGTLLDWLEVDRGRLAHGRSTSLMPVIRGEQQGLRDHVYMLADAERAIRTRAWFLRRNRQGDVELFAKPSDRWEVNEASRLCEDVASGLQQAMAAREQAGADAAIPPLDELLVTEWD